MNNDNTISLGHNLTDFLTQVKTDIINSIQSAGRDASGKIADGIIVVSEESRAELEIPAVLQFMKKGNNPAKPTSPPTIKERIQQWRGPEGVQPTQRSEIKKPASEDSDQAGAGLLTEPLSDENIERRLEPVLLEMAKEIIAAINSQLQSH